MDEESKRLQIETLELARENNKILRKMRRSQQIAGVMRALYWLVIIAVTVGVFYYLEPYINQLKDVYGGASDVLKNFKQISQ